MNLAWTYQMKWLDQLLRIKKKQKHKKQAHYKMSANKSNKKKIMH